MAYFPNAITFTDNAAVNAKQRLRISESTCQWSSGFNYNTSDSLWVTEKVGAGSGISHLPNESSVQLTLDTGASDYIIRQTKQNFSIAAGLSVSLCFYFLLKTAVTNVTKRVGFFDINDGIFLQQDGDGTLKLVRRTSVGGSPSDADAISQANWNIDKMDGTGVSGETLDINTTQCLCFDFFWPTGDIRVGFRINNNLYYIHQFHIANNIDKPFTKNMVEPMRFEMRNTAGSAGATMNLVGSALFTEQECVNPFRSFATGSGVNPTTINSTTTRIPICTIRPKQTYNGIRNKGMVVIEDVDLHVATNSCYFELIYSGTLTGPNWNDVDTNNSMVECDLEATAINGGICLRAGYGVAANKVQSSPKHTINLKFPICLLDVAGSAESGAQVTLCARALTANSVVAGNICWNEIHQ